MYLHLFNKVKLLLKVNSLQNCISRWQKQHCITLAKVKLFFKHFTFLNLFLLHLFVYSVLKIERGKKMLTGLAEGLCLISYLTVTAVANVRNSWNQCSFCDGKSLNVIECKSCWMFLIYRIALALNLHLNKICSKMCCGLSFLFPFMFSYLCRAIFIK